jgi:hypothetical protein
MRTVISHTFMTLDGVAAPDAVIDTIRLDAEDRRGARRLLRQGGRRGRDAAGARHVSESLITSNGVAILTYQRAA